MKKIVCVIYEANIGAIIGTGLQKKNQGCFSCEINRIRDKGTKIDKYKEKYCTKQYF